MLAEDSPGHRLDVARARRRNSCAAARPIGRVIAFAGQALTQVRSRRTTGARGGDSQLRVGFWRTAPPSARRCATSATGCVARGQEQSRGAAHRRENKQRARSIAYGAQAAATFGIRIYTIGVGTQGEAPVPTGQGPLGLRYETMP